jgi:NhaP-type Na+/H+ or K+/H+ antiporter
MSAYLSVMLLVGLGCLAAAVLPRWLQRGRVTVPMVMLALGMLAGYVWASLPTLDPLRHTVVIERFAEFAVLVSLTSAGLKIDRVFGWRAWGTTWRLLALTMPLCIALVAWMGFAWVGLPLAAAVLLGATLAPTDPVLAAEVQVGPPGAGDGNETRFALTSEAGLNDGLAFPFVHLALMFAAAGVANAGAWGEWAAFALGWKVAGGVFAGYVCGRAIAWLVFRAGNPRRAVTDGFAALALTFVAYGVTEGVQGYGFLGVFVAALTFRRFERDHEVHQDLHDFCAQTETLCMAGALMLIGAAIGQGVLLAPLGAGGIALAAVLLLLVRPLTGWLALARSSTHGRARWATAFFGIRGVGSFYYAAYAVSHGDFGEPAERMIFAVIGAVVLGSVMLHGATARAGMRSLGGRRTRADNSR